MKSWISSIHKSLSNTLTNWTVQVQREEFYTYKHKGGVNRIEELMDQYPNALFAVALRDPVERIISNYNFEWQWGCTRCSVQSDYVHHEEDPDDPYRTMTARDFMKWDPKWDKQVDHEPARGEQAQEFKVKFGNIEIGDFLRRVQHFEFDHRDESGRVQFKIAYSDYINNYYLWMFCCDSIHCNIIERDFVATDRIKDCLLHSKRMLMSFDIALVSEWINDVRTQLYVNRMFIGQFANISLEDRFSDLYVGMDKGFKKPNRKPTFTKRSTNNMIRNKDYQQLMEWNRWDIEFYQFLKRLASFREHTVWNQYAASLKGD